MTSLDAMAELRLAADVLERAGAVPRVVEALRAYESGAPEGLTLDRALGLTPGPGGLPWWRIEAHRRRDDYIRQTRQRHFADLGVTEAARVIASRARRLQAIAGQRARQEAPGDELLTAAMCTGLPFPDAKRVEGILRDVTP